MRFCTAVWGGAGGGALGRQVPDVAGAQAGVVDENGDLDATAFEEVRYEVRVLDIAVDGAGLARGHGVDYERAVFDAALQREVLASEELAAGLDVPDEVLLAAADVLVDRYIVALDELVVLEEVGQVLGVVLARLRDEETEAAQQLEADLVLSVNLGVVHRGRGAGRRLQRLLRGGSSRRCG